MLNGFSFDNSSPDFRLTLIIDLRIPFVLTKNQIIQGKDTTEPNTREGLIILINNNIDY